VENNIQNRPTSLWETKNEREAGPKDKKWRRKEGKENIAGPTKGSGQSFLIMVKKPGVQKNSAKRQNVENKKGAECWKKLKLYRGEAGESR